VFLDLLFPKSCLNCGLGGKYICDDCLRKVHYAKPICPVCEKSSIDGFTHIKCKTKLGIDGLTAVWDYEGVIRKAILSLKYKYSTEVGKELISQLVNWLISQRELLHSTSCLLPIPMHWYRQNVRGFNQSIEVGRIVSSEMGWDFSPELLIKKKQTVSQVELKGEERRQNLKGVFSLDSRFLIPDSVVLFDDVFTTGSTLKEATKVLKRAGVQKVWGLTVAR
jgi:ComF family protein